VIIIDIRAKLQQEAVYLQAYEATPS